MSKQRGKRTNLAIVEDLSAINEEDLSKLSYMSSGNLIPERICSKNYDFPPENGQYIVKFDNEEYGMIWFVDGEWKDSKKVIAWDSFDKF